MDVPTPPATAAPRSPAASLPTAWPRSAQLTTAFLLGVSAALLLVQVLGNLRWGSRPSELDRDAGLVYRIDLNRADRAELLQLPGVGEHMAQRIVEYRQRHGLFHDVNELTGVQGIGPTTLETLRPWLRVNSDAENQRALASIAGSSAVRSPKESGSRGSQKEANLTAPININQASAEELQRLPGVGPKMSQRIIEERQKGLFKSLPDLKRVQGIGPKTLQRLAPHVCFEDGPVHVANMDES